MSSRRSAEEKGSPLFLPPAPPPPPLSSDQVDFLAALSGQAEVLERAWAQLDAARQAFEAEKAAWKEQVQYVVIICCARTVLVPGQERTPIGRVSLR